MLKHFHTRTTIENIVFDHAYYGKIFYNSFYGHMKADKQLTHTDDAGHKCDIVINNIH